MVISKEVGLTHLTGFSQPPARHAFRRGLVDHKGGITTSGGREKPAFGGPNPPIGVVSALARYQHRAAHRAWPNERI